METNPNPNPNPSPQRLSITPASYPHIFDAILASLPRASLLSLRPLCHHLRDAVDHLLCREVTLRMESGKPALLGMYSMGGRLPHLYSYASGKGAGDGTRGTQGTRGTTADPSNALNPASASASTSASDSATSASAHVGPYLPFTSTRVLNLLGNEHTATFPLPALSPHIHTIRTYEYGGSRYPPIEAGTWVHFTSLAANTERSQPLPPAVRTLVLNVDMDAGAADARNYWTAWGDAYLDIEVCAQPRVAEVVLIFTSSRSTNTVPDLRRPIPASPVRSARLGPPDVLRPVGVLLAQLWLSPGPPARATFVDFPDPGVVHPSHLGLSVRGQPAGDAVRAAITGPLRAFLKRGIPDRARGLQDDAVEERLGMLEFVTADVYAERVGQEALRLYTDASAFEAGYR